MDVQAMSDDALRHELESLGTNVGPITGTTRSIYEKKLLKLRKEGAKPVVAKATVKPTPKKPQTTRQAASKSPRRSNISRGASSVEEDEAADSDPENPVLVVKPPRSPLTSSPKEATAKADARRLNQSNRTLNSPIPGLTTRTASTPATKKTDSLLASLDKSKGRSNYGSSSVNTSYSTRETGRDLFNAPSYGTPKASLDIFDRPGATPPRTGTSAIRKATTTSSYFSPDQTSSSVSRSFGRDQFANLGHTTDEDDNYGEESTRTVFRSSSSTPYNKRTSPLAGLWQRLSGRDSNEFKVGTPATYYDLKMQGQHTRVEKDPRTGRLRLQHKEFTTSWWDDIPRLLLIIFSIFFVILSVGYVATSQPGTVAAAAQVVAGTVRDSVTFFYNYLILPSALLIAAAALVLVIYFAFKRWRLAKDAEETAVFELVERITDMVRDSALDGEDYISVPHVRDVLFPPAKRRPAEIARWERAVEYINENESRIATETRIIRGHECAVWKWLEARKTGWQGKAFGKPSVPLSPNIPKEALTKFLKIRDLVANDGSDYDKAEQDFRNKIKPTRALHVGYCTEPKTNERLVFAMFANQIDAHKAFMALHGEWYNGRLLNVKYVRDSRYFERFPEAKHFAA